MQRLRTELFALKMALRMAHQYLFDPSLRAVSSIRQFFTMFGQIAYEAVTNNGKTVEEVAVEALGKDRNALSGKVAIITGANSGLGLQNARVLMHYGCTVIWAVRNLEKAQKALDKLDSGEGTHTCEDGHVHRSELPGTSPYERASLPGSVPASRVLRQDHRQGDPAAGRHLRPHHRQAVRHRLPQAGAAAALPHPERDHPRGKTPAPSLASAPLRR